MERQKHFILIFCLLFTVIYRNALAQNSRDDRVYNAYINGNMKEWHRVIEEMENTETLTGNGNKLQLIGYYYGYIGYLLGTEKTDKALEEIVKGMAWIDQVVSTDPANATAYAYKGAFLGFRMASGNFRAMYLGPKSDANIDKAYGLDPDNIQAIIEKGNALYYAPWLFGGNKDKAMEFYERAIRKFESGNKTHKNWLYLNTMANLARTYARDEQYIKAGMVYRKILQREPDFQWVKEELYPSLLKKTDR